MNLIFVYLCLVPLRVFITSKWTLYLPLTTAISLAGVTYQTSSLRKLLVLGSHILSTCIYVKMQYYHIAPWFLALQVIWCQLLLYSAFTVSSFYYRASFEQFKRSNEHLQQMNTSLSTFLSTIGHEIRTPLTAIIGGAEMLLKSQQQEAITFVKMILSSATSLLECTNDLLTFVGLQKNEGPVVQQAKTVVEFNVRTLVKEVMDIALSYALVSNDHVSLKDSWNIDGDIVVEGNYSHTKRILLNLLSNAIKFAPNGDITISVAANSDKCVYTVSDNGIGMNEEFKKRVFTPFVQQDNNIKLRFGGTGLGLSICKSLAEAMCATLTFTSTENVGSTFVLEVPVKMKPAAKISIPSPQYENLESWRVLVIDDNPINVKVMTKLFENCNTFCQGAVSGSEAFALLSNSQFDLIFVDLQMPGMDGVECAKRIRQLPNAPPYIYLVTGAELSSIPQSDQCLFDKVFQKPLRMNTIQCILKALSKREYQI